MAYAMDRLNIAARASRKRNRAFISTFLLSTILNLTDCVVKCANFIGHRRVGDCSERLVGNPEVTT
jgi:hypothetical protein